MPLAAQENPADENVIVVSANRLPGQLDVESAPVDTLEAADIQAIGATSIADLLAAIAPQTGSARGRGGGGGQPIFLVNGIRIGSPREFRSYPPEAIEKVEVFPEEVAQRFGFAPDRRVVNFVLKNNFSSREAEVEFEMPDRGGYSRTEQELSLLRIANGGRLNLGVELSDVSLLTEAERGVIQPDSPAPRLSTDPDPAAYRSLVPDTFSLEASANWAKSFIDSGSSVSLNATFDRAESRSLSGLDTVVLAGPGGSLLRSLNRADPLERRSKTDTYATAGSYTRPVSAFQFTVTFDASLADTATEIERRADTSALVAAAAAGRLPLDRPFLVTPDAGFDLARSKVYDATALLTARGSPLFLPGGELSTTFDLGYDWTRIESDDTRSGTAAQLTRGDLSGGLNLSVPITSRREGFLDAAGDITLSGQVGFNHLSDFGTLYDWSGGLRWSPLEWLELHATYTGARWHPA